TPITSVTPVWLRRSTPCVFVVHIRPQPVNDTRVVRSPARTLGSAVDRSFFPPFPAEVFHRFPQKRNFPVGVSQPFLHPLSGSNCGIDRLDFEAMVTSMRDWAHSLLSFHLHHLVGTGLADDCGRSDRPSRFPGRSGRCSD